MPMVVAIRAVHSSNCLCNGGLKIAMAQRTRWIQAVQFRVGAIEIENRKGDLCCCDAEGGNLNRAIFHFGRAQSRGEPTVLFAVFWDCCLKARTTCLHSLSSIAEE